MPSFAVALRSSAALRMPPVTSNFSFGKRRSRSSSKRVRSRITQITSYAARRLARVSLSAGKSCTKLTSPMLSSTVQSTTPRATSCQSSITAICTAISLTSSTYGVGLAQPGKQGLVKFCRFFHLRCVAQTRELHQSGLREQFRHGFAEHFIVADFRLHRWRCEVLADGGGVGRANQQERRHFQVLELVVHQLGEDHVVDQRRVPRYLFLAGSVVQAREHGHPAFEFRLPLACVIGAALVFADVVGGDFQLSFVPLIDGAIRHAKGFPVFQ